jgi:2-haloacid dehalogenase
MKPSPAIYEAVERKTGHSGEAILYIDDRLENIEAGRQRGWQVVHHSEVSDTRDALRAAGLPV